MALMGVLVLIELCLLSLNKENITYCLLQTSNIYPNMKSSHLMTSGHYGAWESEQLGKRIKN